MSSWACFLNVKALKTVPLFDLVVPLAPQPTAAATDMRTTDTPGQQMQLFDRSGAVSPLSEPDDARHGDVDSTNGLRTATGATTPGRRTSTTATRTTTTRTTSLLCVPSADETAARHAGFSFAELVRANEDCRRAKRTKHTARAFEQQRERHLCQLYEELTAGAYQPGRSYCFVVTHPKPREIWAAPYRDRVVHHLMFNRIAPAFTAGFIADSCACIKERGTLYAAQRLEAKIRSATQNWSRRVHYLKCDLANFFVSIDKLVLHRQLMRRLRDPWTRWLTETVLFHDPRDDYELRCGPERVELVPPHKRLLNQPRHCGLPIGNLSSQFFANVLLDDLDQFVKHTLRVRHYIRYVDDFVLLHESPQQLNAWHDAIAEFLKRELGLRLNDAKTIRQPVDRGVDFVGQVIKPWRRTLRRRTLNTALQRLQAMDAEDLFESANSYFGLARQATHSQRDRARLAKAAMLRGFAVNHELTKTYRRAT